MTAFDKAWGVVKEEGRSFRVQMGPKRLYLVIEYEDGRELFMDDYKQFMMELQQAEATGDERLVEMQFGVGSDYHNIAEEPEEPCLGCDKMIDKDDGIYMGRTFDSQKG